MPDKNASVPGEARPVLCRVPCLCFNNQGSMASSLHGQAGRWRSCCGAFSSQTQHGQSMSFQTPGLLKVLKRLKNHAIMLQGRVALVPLWTHFDMAQSLELRSWFCPNGAKRGRNSLSAEMSVTLNPARLYLFSTKSNALYMVSGSLL